MEGSILQLKKRCVRYLGGSRPLDSNGRWCEMRPLLLHRCTIISVPMDGWHDLSSSTLSRRCLRGSFRFAILLLRYCWFIIESGQYFPIVQSLYLAADTFTCLQCSCRDTVAREENGVAASGQCCHGDVGKVKAPLSSPFIFLSGWLLWGGIIPSLGINIMS